MLIVVVESSPLIFILVIIGFILFAIIANYFSNKNTIFRELKKSKRKPINRVKEGEYVKLIGKALQVNKPLIAPLSQKECVYYHTLIQKDDGDGGWETYIDEKRPQDFFLEVNGELAIIKSTHVYDFRKVYVVFDFEKETKSSKEKTPLIERFIEKHNKSSKTYLFGFKKLFKCSEGVIEINEKIAVKGVAKWKILKEPIAGYSYSKILTINGTSDKELLISDAREALKLINKS